MLDPLLAPSEPSPPGRWGRTALVIWSLLTVASCLRCVFGGPGADYPVNAAAGRHWVCGADLYPDHDGWNSFLYSPLIAVFLAPYGSLPMVVGNVLWRLTLIGGFAAALWSFARTLPTPLTAAQKGILYLLVLPLTAATLTDGQAGALVAASLLFAAASASTGRWNAAAAWSAFACLIKIYPVAFALLLGLAYPKRFAGRFAVALAVGLIIPFTCQQPDYVTRQYAQWFHVLGSSDRGDWDLNIANRDVALLFRVWGRPLDSTVWKCIQLLAAAGAAVLCVKMRLAGWSRPRVVASLLGLATCWMVLFGPVVESFTYILVGPTLACLLLDAWSPGGSAVERIPLTASWTIFASATAAVWVMKSIIYHRVGPHPAAGLFLLTGLLIDLGRRFARDRSQTTPKLLTAEELPAAA
jgi:hypothetical protein